MSRILGPLSLAAFIAAVAACGGQQADQAANKKKTAKPTDTTVATDKPAAEVPVTTAAPVNDAKSNVETVAVVDDATIPTPVKDDKACILPKDPDKEPAKITVSAEDQAKFDALKDALAHPNDFARQAARLDQIPFSDQKVGPKQQARAADYADYVDAETALGEFKDQPTVDRWHAVRGRIDADAAGNVAIADAFDTAHTNEIDAAINGDFDSATGAKFWRWYMKVLEQPYPDNYPNYHMNIFACGAWVASTVPDQWKATAAVAAKDLRDKFVYKVAVGDPGTLTWFRKEAARALAEVHDEQLAIYNATIAYCLRVD